jgi:hypothetical protein
MEPQGKGVIVQHRPRVWHPLAWDSRHLLRGGQGRDHSVHPRHRSPARPVEYTRELDPVYCVVEIGGPGTIAMSLAVLAVGGPVSLIGASLSRSGTGLDPLLLTGRVITMGRSASGDTPILRR